MNLGVGGPETSSEWGGVERSMQQYPGIERALIEEHIRLGYTEGEIKDILDALGENANNAGYRASDPRRTRSMNEALATLIQRFRDTLNSRQLGQYVKIMTNGVMNPPDATGKRKSVILYAPGYSEEATASITKSWEQGGVGGYVAKSCEQLRKQIRELGGP